MISIICPVYNEKKYIAQCIDSVLNSNFPTKFYELIFIDGMSTDGTREIIKEYQKKHPQIVLLDNPQHIVSPALNLGIKKATGDYIFRIDAHSQYPQDYFSTLLEKKIELNADNVGGGVTTLPADSSSKSTAIATALSSRFGMGNSYFRVGSKTIRQVDTVPFGCFSKEIFEKIGYFDEELIRNQDDEFNGRIIKNGGTIFLIPTVQIRYFSRNKIKNVRKMFYQYGLFKPLVNKKLQKAMTVRQFVPLLFILGLIIGAGLAIFSNILMILYFSIIILYLILNFSFSIAETIKQKRKTGTLFWLPAIFLIVHLSYGWGYLVGILKIITNRPFSVKYNR